MREMRNANKFLGLRPLKGYRAYLCEQERAGVNEGEGIETPSSEGSRKKGERKGSYWLPSIVPFRGIWGSAARSSSLSRQRV